MVLVVLLMLAFLFGGVPGILGSGAVGTLLLLSQASSWQDVSILHLTLLLMIIFVPILVGARVADAVWTWMSLPISSSSNNGSSGRSAFTVLLLVLGVDLERVVIFTTEAATSISAANPISLIKFGSGIMHLLTAAVGVAFITLLFLELPWLIEGAINGRRSRLGIVPPGIRTIVGVLIAYFGFYFMTGFIAAESTPTLILRGG